MADKIKRLSEGHTVEVLDGIMTEVEEARGEHGSLGERLEAMGSGGKMTVTDLIEEPIVGSVSTIALNDSISNYDFIAISVGVTAANKNQQHCELIPVVDALASSNSFLVTAIGYVGQFWAVTYNISFTAQNEVTVNDSGQYGWGESRKIFSIKGIKF